jgi:rod shape-determining protein MreD
MTLAHWNWGKEIVVLQSTPPSRAEVYRIPLAVLILVPVLALILQFCLPVYFPSSSVVDLPLLVVIYFALARRSPVAGLLAGALIGVAQDSLSRDPIGLYAISKTVVGYVTSVISSRMEPEMPGIRFVIIFFLFYLHFFCRYALGTALLTEMVDFSLVATLSASLVNAFFGVLLFLVLDRFRTPA